MNDLPPLGQPEDAEPEPDTEDFAAEHDDTAVDEDITGGRDGDREPESPRGWAGLEPE
ncbi:hypothetical protein [Micromonospora sp. CPCC 206061]|uniref:hypothetical protein n=1 Tax=Micromonospora sp. CPCC 206061 TaxID=3122410 RepID=UPI002FF36D1F